MNRIFKRTSYISIAILSIVLISFSVYSYLSLNDNKVEKSYFENAFYVSKDKENFLSFGDFSDSVFYCKEEYYFFEEMKYEENIITFENEFIKYHFIVINKNTLFNDYFNIYLHNVRK